MNCQTVQKNWVAYLDGRIELRRRREVESHLAVCASCREQAEQFRELWDVLDEAPVILPSAGFDAAVRARIARESQGPSFWSWLMVPSPRLAIGITALVAFSIWLSALPPTAQAPAPAPVAVASEAEFKMIADLPVLEDYDVLSNFDVLSELPMLPPADKTEPGM
jgi:anti-sigma factor RsiW